MSDEPPSPAPIRLGILQCDSVPADLQAQFGDYPDMFRQLLGAGDRPIEFRNYDLTRGQFPESLDECDAWLFTGSKWSVYDPDEWIADAHELARELHAERRPSVGICFGHQLFSRALGGDVAKADVGWGVGVHTTHVLQRQSWMEPERDSLALLVSHQDQVERPPEGATLLAAHDFCPYDILQIGDHILTFQGHPEFPKGYSRAMIERRRDAIGLRAYQEGLQSLEGTVEAEIAAAWIRCFLERSRARQ